MFSFRILVSKRRLIIIRRIAHLSFDFGLGLKRLFGHGLKRQSVAYFLRLALPISAVQIRLFFEVAIRRRDILIRFFVIIISLCKC